MSNSNQKRLVIAYDKDDYTDRLIKPIMRNIPNDIIDGNCFKSIRANSDLNNIYSLQLAYTKNQNKDIVINLASFIKKLIITYKDYVINPLTTYFTKFFNEKGANNESYTFIECNNCNNEPWYSGCDILIRFFVFNISSLVYIDVSLANSKIYIKLISTDESFECKFDSNYNIDIDTIPSNFKDVAISLNSNHFADNPYVTLRVPSIDLLKRNSDNIYYTLGNYSFDSIRKSIGEIYYYKVNTLFDLFSSALYSKSYSVKEIREDYKKVLKLLKGYKINNQSININKLKTEASLLLMSLDNSNRIEWKNFYNLSKYLFMDFNKE